MQITPELIKQAQQDLRDHRLGDLNQLRLSDPETHGLRVMITAERVVFQHKDADLTVTNLEDARNAVRLATGA